MCVLIELELDTRTFGRVEMVIRELCVVMTCLMMTIQIHTTFYKTWGHRLMCGYKSRRHDVYEQLNWEKGRDPTSHQPTKYLYRLVQLQLKTGENQACYKCNECNKCVSPGLVTAWQLSWYLLPAAECRSWPQMLSHYQAIVTASNPRWKCHIKTFNKLFSTFTYLLKVSKFYVNLKRSWYLDTFST